MDFDPYHKWLGIPPQHQPPTHYRLLGLEPFEADADVIAAAAERQTAHIQSYKIGPQSELSQRLLTEIARAKICLLNPASRDKYDRELREGQIPSPPATAPPVQASSTNREPAFTSPPPDLGLEAAGLDTSAAELLVPRREVMAARRPIAGSRTSDRLLVLLVLAMGIVLLVTLTLLALRPTPESTMSAASRPSLERPVDASLPRDIRQPYPRPNARRPAPSPPHRPSPRPPSKPNADRQPNQAPRMHLPAPIPQHDAQPQVEFPRDFALPNGKQINLKALSIARNDIVAMFPADQPGNNKATFILTDPKSTKPTGLFIYNDRGTLDGPFLVINEDGKPIIFGAFSANNRDGQFRHWNSGGALVSYTEYNNDRRAGLRCLLEDGRVALAEEWSSKGRLLKTYLVENAQVIRLLESSEINSTEQSELLAAHKHTLRDLDAKLSANEARWKRIFQNWWRGNDTNIRQLKERIRVSEKAAKSAMQQQLNELLSKIRSDSEKGRQTILGALSL